MNTTEQRKIRTEEDRILKEFSALTERQQRSALDNLLGRMVVRDPQVVRDALAFARGERRAF